MFSTEFIAPPPGDVDGDTGTSAAGVIGGIAVMACIGIIALAFMIW